MQTSQDIGPRWIPPEAASPDMGEVVKKWFDAGTKLVWRPIFDRQNFPEATKEALMAAHESGGYCWLISEVDDLLSLPEGINGWIRPMDADDTDIACGLWEDRVTFMSVSDGRTGRRVTYRTDAGCGRVAE